MSCYNGCYSTPTISCSPYPSASTGCLDYVSTDCVQYLGTSYAIGFGILQGDTLTTMVTKIAAATVSANTWLPMSFVSGSTYNGNSAQVTVNTKGEVKFTGIVYVSGSATGTATICNPFISSTTLMANYTPATNKQYIITGISGTTATSGVAQIYVLTIYTSGIITVANLTNTTTGIIGVYIDFSQIWYDKNI